MCRIKGSDKALEFRPGQWTHLRVLCSFQWREETYVVDIEIDNKRHKTYRLLLRTISMGSNPDVIKLADIKVAREFAISSRFMPISATFVEGTPPYVALILEKEIVYTLDIDGFFPRRAKYSAQSAYSIDGCLYLLSLKNEIIVIFPDKKDLTIPFRKDGHKYTSIMAKRINDKIHICLSGTNSVRMFVDIQGEMTSSYLTPNLSPHQEIYKVAVFGTSKIIPIILLKDKRNNNLTLCYKHSKKSPDSYSDILPGSEKVFFPSCMFHAEIDGKEYLVAGTTNSQILIWDFNESDSPKLSWTDTTPRLCDSNLYKVNDIIQVRLKNHICFAARVVRDERPHRNYLFHVPCLSRALELASSSTINKDKIELLDFLSSYPYTWFQQVNIQKQRRTNKFFEFPDEIKKDGFTIATASTLFGGTFLFAQENSIIRFFIKNLHTYRWGFSPSPFGCKVIALAHTYSNNIIAAMNTNKDCHCCWYDELRADDISLENHRHSFTIPNRNISCMAYSKDSVALCLESLEKGSLKQYSLEIWNISPWFTGTRPEFLSKTGPIPLPCRAISVDINPLNNNEYLLVYDTGEIKVLDASPGRSLSEKNPFPPSYTTCRKGHYTHTAMTPLSGQAQDHGPPFQGTQLEVWDTKKAPTASAAAPHHSHPASSGPFAMSHQPPPRAEAEPRHDAYMAVYDKRDPNRVVSAHKSGKMQIWELYENHGVIPIQPIPFRSRINLLSCISTLDGNDICAVTATGRHYIHINEGTHTKTKIKAFKSLSS